MRSEKSLLPKLVRRCRAWHLLFIASVCAVLVGGCAHENGVGEALAPKFHPYGFDHGHFHFEYEDGSRGTEDVYIDSFGINEARLLDLEIITPDGFKPNHTLTIKHGSDVTVIDSGKRTGAHFIDPSLDSLNRLSSVPSYEQQLLTLFKKIGYEHVGDTLIAGLTARKWHQAGTPFYLFESRAIVVRRRAEAPNQTHNMYLVSFDTTTPIDHSRFMVPHGFEIREREQAQQ